MTCMKSSAQYKIRWHDISAPPLPSGPYHHMDGCYTFDQSNVQLSLCRYHTPIKTIWENLHINPYTIGRFWMIITTKTAFKTQSYHRLPPTCWQAGQGKYFKIKITTEVRKILPFKNELNIFIQQSVNQPTSTIDGGSLHCKSRIIIIINYQLMKREFQLPVLVTVSRIIVCSRSRSETTRNFPCDILQVRTSSIKSLL